MSDIAVRFLIANLAIGAAVLVVLALRAPVRAMFGARLTYALWLLVPLAGVASLLPPRVEQQVAEIASAMAPPEIIGQWQRPAGFNPAPRMPAQDQPFRGDALQASEPAAASTVARETSGFAAPNPFVLAGIVWFAGMIAMALWQLRRQSRFVSDAKAGFAGPAVVGVIKPRIVTPSDFETTFDASEREVILTHERIHIEGNDARINAMAALAGCICWFNPLVHLGAYFMRIDQELACDAGVVTRHPEARSLYASALLKAQLARAPLPLGCHWPARSEHPLLQRVEMLSRAEPGRMRRIAGVAVLGLLAAASGVTAWAALPPEKRVVERHRIDRQDMHVEMRRGDGPALPGQPEPFHADADFGPVPAPPQPEQPPAPPAAKGEQLPANFDANDPVYLRGTVEKIDFAETTYTAYVRARSIATSPAGAAKQDAHLWKLSPINYWGDRERVSKDILKQDVDVTGYRATDKTCGPDCQMHVSTMIKCSVQATFAPGCAPEPGQAAPYQQQTPPAPRPVVINGPAYFSNGQAIDPITIRGKVERIDFGDTKYTVFVRASSASWPGGFTEKADTSLFELSPTPFWGDRDAINSELKGKEVLVQGAREAATCDPACKVKTISLKVAQPTALTPITQTPGFSSADVVMRYDASGGTMIQGVVQRIEFGERSFDAYVQLRSTLGVPGELYQVRSEYRLPRADIEKQLKGKTVYIAGWPAKQQTDTTCSSPCGLYATDIRLASGDIITPAGMQLVSKAPGAAPDTRRCFKEYNSAPGRGVLRCTSDDGRGAPLVDVRSFEANDRYDIDAPVTIDGRIVRADRAGFWVEVNAFEPVDTPGAAAGTTWYVENDTPDKTGYLGQHITARGLNAKDKACKPECRMFALGYSVN